MIQPPPPVPSFFSSLPCRAGLLFVVLAVLFHGLLAYAARQPGEKVGAASLAVAYGFSLWFLYRHQQQQLALCLFVTGFSALTQLLLQVLRPDLFPVLTAPVGLLAVLFCASVVLLPVMNRLYRWER